jgi:hypothetical protein
VWRARRACMSPANGGSGPLALLNLTGFCEACGASCCCGGGVVAVASFARTPVCVAALHGFAQIRPKFAHCFFGYSGRRATEFGRPVGRPPQGRRARATTAGPCASVPPVGSSRDGPPGPRRHCGAAAPAACSRRRESEPDGSRVLRRPLPGHCAAALRAAERRLRMESCANGVGARGKKPPGLREA